MLRTRYLISALLAAPLFPLLYLDARKVKARVPQLPEATGPAGLFGSGEGPARPLRMLAIGESTVAGVGVDTHAEGLTGSLAAELHRRCGVPVAWRVYARSGYTARKVLVNILPTIEESRADLIVLGLGANDVFKLNTLAGWQRDIRELIGRLRDTFPGSAIVFCNMPPIREFPAFTPLLKYTLGNMVELFGQALEETVRPCRGVFYSSRFIKPDEWLDRYDIEASADDFFSDGVHPSKLTYQIWAKDLARVIWEEPEIRQALTAGFAQGRG